LNLSINIFKYKKKKYKNLKNKFGLDDGIRNFEKAHKKNLIYVISSWGLNEIQFLLNEFSDYKHTYPKL
jgi:hypothetical protein